jgi:hypothetical protein
MKTIFITIFEGVEVKNILRTTILTNLLTNSDIRIVLFTKSQDKVDYYKKEFNDPRIVFEVVEWKSPSAIDRFFTKLKFVLLRTETTNLKRKMVSEYEGEYVRYYTGLCMNFLLARPLVRKIARLFDFLLVSDATYAKYFDTYKPDLVFLAHLFDEPEIALLREAKKRKVKSIGFVNSWDKITSRCIMRLLPDKAIVFNELVKQELITYNEMSAEDIYVSGLPQYDYFYTPEKYPAPEKKFIVYASMGRAFSISDWDMIDLMYTIVTSDQLREKCDLLVRFQPNDFVDQEELKKRPHLWYDVPGIRFGSKRGVDWDMNAQDLAHLKKTLQTMSVLVCYASSISVDAAVFDKPIININFEIQKSAQLLKSPTQYYKSAHYKNALSTSAIDLVSSKSELIDAVNKYLEHPEYKKEERKALVLQQCAFADGLAGERIYRYIWNNLTTTKNN